MDTQWIIVTLLVPAIAALFLAMRQSQRDFLGFLQAQNDRLLADRKVWYEVLEKHNLLLQTLTEKQSEIVIALRRLNGKG